MAQWYVHYYYNVLRTILMVGCTHTALFDVSSIPHGMSKLSVKESIVTKLNSMVAH